MRIMETKVYTFDELSDKAKEVARQWYRDINAGPGDDVLFEPALAAAKILGIEFNTQDIQLRSGKIRKEPCIYYSGFSSQGNGASFEGTYQYAKGSVQGMRAEFPQDLEIQRIARDLYNLNRKQVFQLRADIAQGKFGGNYVHENTMDAYAYRAAGPDSWAEQKDVRSETAKELLQLMRDFAKWIYRGLEQEYEYRGSDERVDESILANEYEFTEAGKLI